MKIKKLAKNHGKILKQTCGNEEKNGNRLLQNYFINKVNINKLDDSYRNDFMVSTFY